MSTQHTNTPGQIDLLTLDLPLCPCDSQLKVTFICKEDRCVHRAELYCTLC